MNAIRILILALSLAGGVAAAKKPAPTVRGVVNLNQAEPAKIGLLPGIGETKAARIVDWRKSHPYKKVEDLVRVKGIGRKTVARLRPYLTVAGPTTLSAAPAAASK